MELCITEIVEDEFSTDKEVVWLKCKTSSNQMVAFWGELDGPNRNIVSLRHQQLPVLLEILARRTVFLRHGRSLNIIYP